MAIYRVSSRTVGSVEVDAANWLVALGEGLQKLGVSANMDRLACEVLPNSTILVRDVRRGDGYIVQPLGETVAPEPELDEEIMAAPPAEDEEHPPKAGIVEIVDGILDAPARDLAVKRALDGAIRIVPSESGAVLLADRSGALSFAAAHGPEAHKLLDVAIPAGTGVAGFCVSRQVGLTVKEPYADDRFCREVDSLTGYRTRTILCVPVAVERRVFGCLELLNAIERDAYGVDAMADAEIVANALAERLASPGPLGR